MISGHGTIALEWFEQMQEDLSQILIPLGAGALLSGIALAARNLYPNIRIVGVQAASSPYLYSQFHHGHMENIVERPTIMEGLAGALEQGAVTIEMISELCDDVVLVDDEDAKKAVAYVWHEFGKIAEPSGVAGLAAVLTNKVSVEGHLTGTIISGGNIDS